MKSNFITVASHEIITPVTMIRAYADMMFEGSLGEVTSLQREGLSATPAVGGPVRVVDGQLEAEGTRQRVSWRNLLLEQASRISKIHRPSPPHARAARTGHRFDPVGSR